MRRILAGVCFIAFVGSVSACAGNIALTGHDDDFHQSVQAQAQALAMIQFARAGSALPVLTFDHGTELTTLLTTLGISFVNVDPDTGVPVGTLFDHSVYSAIVVASDQSCGGCDNTATSSANLAGASASIATFFNAGGGIAAFAGASNSSYYSFLPATALNPGTVTCDSCFTQTADGAAAGIMIPAVNGDFPHNFFEFPGVGGMDPLWKAAEIYSGPSSIGTLTDQPFTVFIKDATIGGGGFGGGVPEPGTYAMMLGGLGSLLLARKRLSR